MPDSADALVGMRVLVVEDDSFVASYVDCVIRAAGANVLGPFPVAREALASIVDYASGIHAAFLNFTLKDGDALTLAEELTRAMVPIIFSTGLTNVDLPSRFSRCPVLARPFAACQVVDELVATLQRRPMAQH
jgi:DNA-binding response OmpR family regulator